MTYITGQPIVFIGTGQTYADLKNLNVKAVVNILMKWSLVIKACILSLTIEHRYILNELRSFTGKGFDQKIMLLFTDLEVIAIVTGYANFEEFQCESRCQYFEEISVNLVS